MWSTWSTLSAWLDGARRVTRAPAIIVAIWIAALLMAWPIAMSSRVDLSLQLVSPAGGAPRGLHERVHDELRAQTLERSVEFGGGVAQMVVEPGAFIDYLSRWLVSLTASYPFLALGMLMAGGVIDRYARQRPTGAQGVAAASGAFLVPFLRLGIVVALVYALAFRLVGQWPTVLAGVLALTNTIVRYAQVRAVVEDRRSMLGAIRASLLFMRRNLAAVVGLEIVNWSLFAAITAVYVMLGPGSGFRFGPDRPVVWTVLLWIATNQLYVIARLWTGLLFLASATSLFQRRLAHAGYVARPLPTWPDSPSVEAIQRLER